jgi:hypothetical protein
VFSKQTLSHQKSKLKSTVLDWNKSGLISLAFDRVENLWGKKTHFLVPLNLSQLIELLLELSDL